LRLWKTNGSGVSTGAIFIAKEGQFLDLEHDPEKARPREGGDV
jgi:hypothetical protein